MEQNESLKRIQELCDQRGWSIYKLAKESGIPYSSVNNIFIRNTQPTLPTLEKICKGFRIQISDFFNDTPLDAPKTYVLSDEEENLLFTYRSLCKDDKMLLENFIEFLKSKPTE